MWTIRLYVCDSGEGNILRPEITENDSREDDLTDTSQSLDISSPSSVRSLTERFLVGVIRGITGTILFRACGGRGDNRSENDPDVDFLVNMKETMYEKNNCIVNFSHGEKLSPETEK